MNYLKIAFGVLVVLSASRFVPHPPNFTSLLALSFYIPAVFGIRYIPVVVVSLLLTDLFIGFHGVTLFTWGSVVLIGLISKFFLSTTFSRISGSLVGACIFFIVTNFGVWSLGTYGYSFEGFIACYTLAIPFFVNSIFSTLIFSIIIEIIYSYYIIKKNKLILKK